MARNYAQLLTTILATQESTIAFLKENALIKVRHQCTICSVKAAWTSDASKGDGYMWRCGQCKGKTSIRENSWFKGSKLPLRTMLKLLYFWVQDVQQDYAMFECDVGSKTTMVDFWMYARQICCELLERHSEMIGGTGKVVEVDEAKICRRKYNTGRLVDGTWIFGIVERGTNSRKCALIPVQSRDEETLTAEIKKLIAPGTVVISDYWKAYSKLSDQGYIHLTVNHSENYVYPITGANTNTVEGLWNLMRRSMPKFGTQKHFYASYMVEFMYRRKFFTCKSRGERFNLFIEHLAELGDIW